MNINPYLSTPAEIEDIIDETPSIKTFVLRPAAPIAFEAGQFVELSVPGVGEAPFTPSSSPRVHERMDITIMNVGRVTRRLHALAKGAEVAVRGPLGSAYPLEEFRGREVLLVGGGCGVGPLRALLFALMEDLDAYRKVILRYGSRSTGDIVFRQAVESNWGQGDGLDVMLTVDTAPPTFNGHVGVVTTILDEQHLSCHPDEGVAVLCGPPVMMMYTVRSLRQRGYTPENIYLSMEKNMSCGFGKCGHCRLGPYYACREGPVFTYAQIAGCPGIWR
jgi:NAD(P)H-flavin reductase